MTKKNEQEREGKCKINVLGISVCLTCFTERQWRVVRRGGQKHQLQTTELLLYSKPPVLHYYQLAGSSSDRSSVVITVNGFLQVFLIVGKHVQKHLSQGGVMLAHRL